MVIAIMTTMRCKHSCLFLFQVYCCIAGDQDETGVRTLEDPKRKLYRRGSQDNLLLTTKHSLGKLSRIRLWHDNTGKGKYASWFLNFIVIQDLQTMERFYFIANDWFAVEHSDGRVCTYWLCCYCGIPDQLNT